MFDQAVLFQAFAYSNNFLSSIHAEKKYCLSCSEKYSKLNNMETVYYLE